MVVVKLFDTGPVEIKTLHNTVIYIIPHIIVGDKYASQS